MRYSEESVFDLHHAVLVDEFPPMDQELGVFAHLIDGEECHVMVVELRDGTRLAKILYRQPLDDASKELQTG
jgi:hypothetical protein